MPGSFLHLPRDFAGDSLWTDPLHAAWYISLQLRADPDGIIKGWSLREAAQWWSTSTRQVSRFLQQLDDRQLVRFPQGQPGNRPYPIELRDYWGPPETAENTDSSPEGVTAESPSAATTPTDQAGEGETADSDGFELTPEQQENGKSPVNRIMQMIHQMGLNAASHITGRLWAKQARKVKTLISQYGEEGVEAAVRGMPYIFPWNKEDAPPWDAFNLENSFAKAVAAYQRKEAERQGDTSRREEARARERQAQAETERYGEAMAHWRRDMMVRARRLSEEEQKEIGREAKERLRDVPFSNEEMRRRAIRQTALQILGERTGRPPPTPPRPQ